MVGVHVLCQAPCLPLRYIPSPLFISFLDRVSLELGRLALNLGSSRVARVTGICYQALLSSYRGCGYYSKELGFFFFLNQASPLSSVSALTSVTCPDRGNALALALCAWLYLKL